MKLTIKTEIERTVATITSELIAVGTERAVQVESWLSRFSTEMIEKLESLTENDIRFYGIIDTKSFLNAYRIAMSGMKNWGDTGRQLMQMIQMKL